MVKSSTKLAGDETSLHYWWYQYLRRHGGYRGCCERGGTGPYSALYADFGDVHKLTFKDWWRDHKGLFVPHGIEPFDVDQVKTDKHFKVCRDDEGIWVLAVNSVSSKRALQRAFKEFLKRHHPRKRGRPKFADSMLDDTLAEYPKYANATPRALKTTLEVYDLRRQIPLLKLWQIGQYLHLNEQERTTGDRDMDARDKNRVMTSIVSRYIRHARAMIKNVGEGRFPQKTL